MVDLSKIKPGDEVLVRAVVDSVRDFEGGAQLLIKVEDWRRTPNVSDAWNYAGVNVDQIASHTPKPLAVGDRVRVGTLRLGEVLATCGRFAWVKWAEDDVQTYGIHVLERADA